METPMKYANIRVTSKFGPRTYIYQGQRVSDDHKGIDMVGNPRSNDIEICAFADGVVTAVQKTGIKYGTMCFVRIKHNNGWYTVYYHFKSNSIVVNVGDKVVKGQKLGIIGDTGKATDVHLHFQIDKGTKASAIDPYDYLFNGKMFIPDSDPIPTPITEWPKYYTIKSGDTLSQIAKDFYGRGDAAHYNFIAQANNISNPNIINVGVTLIIPQYIEHEVTPIPEPTPTPATELKIGDKVKIINTGSASSSKLIGVARGLGWTREILKIWKGRAYPYQIGNSSGTTGFYKAEALEKQ